MTRKSSSQWNFGELFPPEATRRVFSVADLTSHIKRLLETQVGTVWVSGEVSNLRLQASGHRYFTLKDAAAQLACVLFRGDARASASLLDDGHKVLLHGHLSVYEPRGQYQLIVDAVEAQGLGALQLAFERLKQKLDAEGLFDPARKRPIPPLPTCIGIATSPTGAALQDVLHVVRRRYPALRIVLAPCRVQGAEAAAEIAAALDLLNDWHASALAQAPATTPSPPRLPPHPLDLILVTRGGGSLEDLWPFNEEVVARAIARSQVPVVSAVGHEIDFTISDFTADLRAATPSAAAEMITQGAVAALEFLAAAAARLDAAARRHLGFHSDHLDTLAARLTRAHPRRRVLEHWQRLDDLKDTLDRVLRYRLGETRTRWQGLRARWLAARPRVATQLHQESLARLSQQLQDLGHRHLTDRTQRLESLQQRLRLLSPQHILARGYSITRDARTGTILRHASDTQPGQTLRTHLHDGEITSVIPPAGSALEV